MFKGTHVPVRMSLSPRTRVAGWGSRLHLPLQPVVHTRCPVAKKPCPRRRQPRTLHRMQALTGRRLAARAGLSAVRLAPTSASRGAVRRLATSMGQVQEAIEAKLTRALQPEALVVQNDSHKHNVPPNSETHFTVTVVSREFEGAKLLAVRGAALRAGDR